MTAERDVPSADGERAAVGCPELRVEIGPLKAADAHQRGRQVRVILRLLRRAAREQPGQAAILRRPRRP